MSSYFERICNQEILLAAWRKVKSKSAPPGIDRVSCDDFETNLADNITKLRDELLSGDYKPLPVITFKRKRKAKGTRIIGIPVVRDRIVQQAISIVLTPRFERIFLPCSYAYRPGRSALHAVRQAHELIKSGHFWVLQMDVKDYFESLDHSILLYFLGQAIQDRKIIRIISKLLKARIFYQMGIFDHLTGTHQGSGLSPLLSNVYLHPLDHTLWKLYKGSYLRYSDDIAIFAKDKERLVNASNEVEICLRKLKLEVHPEKTTITHMNDGIIYLGYYLDSRGIGPSKKSIEALVGRLKLIGSIRPKESIYEKILEAKSVIRGWLSYYRDYDFSEPPNIISLLAMFEILLETGKNRQAKQLLKQVKRLKELKHPDIFIRIGDAYALLGMDVQAMRHYAKAMELNPENPTVKGKIEKIRNNCSGAYDRIKYAQLILQSNPSWREGYQELRDSYLEIGLYGFAEKAHDKMIAIDDEEPDFSYDYKGGRGENLSKNVESCFDYRKVDQELFTNLFSGRKESHGKQWIDERGKWGFVHVVRPIKKKDILKHLQGEHTLAVYPVTVADTVQFIVFDIDTAKKAILSSSENALDEFRVRAHSDVMRIKQVCCSIDGKLYIEDSGYKGRHGWLFFDKYVPAKEAMALGKQILKIAGEPSRSMVWELYPRGKSERAKSLIKLPLGINKKSNRRCLFLDDSGNPYSDQGLFLQTIERSPWDKMVTNLRDMSINPEGAKEVAARRSDGISISSAGLARMVQNCKVIKHLVEKAYQTHYLTHFERVCLLYTLTFAGKEGVELLHRVIGYCINYDQKYTQRQIDKRKESPISCAKIMEFFPELTESLSCNCNFHVPPRGYPSPVLHLLEYEIEGDMSLDQGSGEKLKGDGVDSSTVQLANSKSEMDGDDYGVILDFKGIFDEEDIDPGKTLMEEENELTIENTDKSPGGSKCEKNESKVTDESELRSVDFSLKQKIAELVQEYTHLKSQIDSASYRLKAVVKKLDDTFTRYNIDTIDTPIGEVTWKVGDEEGKRLTIRS